MLIIAKNRHIWSTLNFSLERGENAVQAIPNNDSLRRKLLHYQQNGEIEVRDGRLPKPSSEQQQPVPVQPPQQSQPRTSRDGAWFDQPPQQPRRDTRFDQPPRSLPPADGSSDKPGSAGRGFPSPERAAPAAGAPGSAETDGELPPRDGVPPNSDELHSVDPSEDERPDGDSENADGDEDEEPEPGDSTDPNAPAPHPRASARKNRHRAGK